MSTLVQTVRTMFDLPQTTPDCVVPDPLPDVMPSPGRIVLITGPSGSGKSRLLAAIKRRYTQATWMDPTSVRFRGPSVIDAMCAELDATHPDRVIEPALALLSRVGLAEAWTYLQTPDTLSDGQRWRLVLAVLVARASRSTVTAIIAMDEFAALLDRVTAMIVARALRKLIAPDSSMSAIVVTSHDDLVDALSPDTHIECDFGEYRVRHAQDHSHTQ